MIRRRGCELDTCQIVNDRQEFARGRVGGGDVCVHMVGACNLIYLLQVPQIHIKD